MARYDDVKVPRGTSRRWEVLISDGEETERPPSRQRTALEFQREHRVLHDLSPDLLREMPLLDQGTRLERRREYLDLHDPARADFRAEGFETVKPGQRIVARSDVSDVAWAELRAACEAAVRRPPLRRAG
jgi:hypothetical protein